MTNNYSTDLASSPFNTTFRVWKALFLREAVTRITASRAAWIWLFIEPAVHIGLMMFIFTVVRVRVISGIETGIWLLIGMLAIFTYKRTATQTTNAISSNRSLFAYRQVKPVDTVLTRGYLEGYLMLLVSLLTYSTTFLLGFGMIPYDPLVLVASFAGLWLTGLGFGLIASVLTDLIPELGKIISMLNSPIYLISGVVFPIASIPDPYRSWLMINPLVHGIESARSAISPYYHPLSGLDLGYLFECAFGFVFLGLALHKRFAVTLAMK